MQQLKSWASAQTATLARIIIIVLAAAIIHRILANVIPRIERLAEDEDPTTTSEREKRARTLSRILKQLLAFLVWGVAITLLLGELGVQLGPILAGAGIAGLAVGFGAQTLVKDVISGFFILFENQFRVNDVISTAGVSGLVEAINLRTTVLRDIQGRVHVIPNGSIGVVSNLTREWSRAVLDIGVAYKEDTDRCMKVLKEVGEELERDPAYGPKLVSPFEYPGVETLGDSAVVLRMMAKTHPLEQFDVMRELRRRVKKAFDREKIEIPYPHLTLYLGETAGQGKLKLQR